MDFPTNGERSDKRLCLESREELLIG
jgi:hypothetical protein